MNFEFASAGRIIFGVGSAAQAGALAAIHGRRALITIGVNPERVSPVIRSLKEADITTAFLRIQHEPTLDVIHAGVEQARRFECNVVIGIGGGSAIDSGKAIAALAVNPGEALDYLEVVGRGLPLEKTPLPFIAIPTTAGTGSEATRNAVIGVPDRGVKVSLRSPAMLPRTALVDPELTYGLPPEVTAASGLDALTQLIEPFTSNRTNPLVDAICREGIRICAPALRRAYQDGRDSAAREAMSLAALFGGMALANARLGAVHGFAAVLGGSLEAPHGALCARLLPGVLRANVAALRERDPDHPVLVRYTETARLLTGRPDAPVEAGLDWVSELVEDLQIPRLGQYGLKSADFARVIPAAKRAGSMQGNPIALTDSELSWILEAAL